MLRSLAALPFLALLVPIPPLLPPAREAAEDQAAEGEPDPETFGRGDVEATLVDEDGPVAGVEVVLERRVSAVGVYLPAEPLASARSDEAGRVSFEDLDAFERYSVRVRDPAYRWGIYGVRVHEPLELQLQRARTLRGRLIESPGGAPLQGVEVFPMMIAHNQAGMLAYEDDRYPVTTGSSGDFVLLGAPSRAFTLVARPPEGAFSFQLRVPAELEQLDLHVPSEVRGLQAGRTVLVALTTEGTPQSGVRVVVSGREVGETDEHGKLELRHSLEPGPGRGLELRPAGSTVRTACALYPKSLELERLELPVYESVPVLGRVADSSGKAIEGVVLRLFGRSGTRRQPGAPSSDRADNPLLRYEWEPRTSLPLRTAADGRFRIDGVPPGEAWSLRLGGRGWVDQELTSSRPGHVPGEPLEIEMQRAGTIQGVVRHEDGRRARALVSESPADQRDIYHNTTYTNARGEFRLEGVSPGRVVVRARPGRPAHNSISMTAFTDGPEIRLEAGETVRCDLVLDPDAGSLILPRRR